MSAELSERNSFFIRAVKHFIFDHFDPLIENRFLLFPLGSSILSRLRRLSG